MSLIQSRIELRPNDRRGGGEQRGWLKTLFTFSVPGHYDGHGLDSFGSLRVINEDRVKMHNGFGFHSHKEFEIFSYLVHGSLQHKDSMGNVEILKRGDIQLTSAGTGITHSETCHGDEDTHFIQIWAMPWKSNLQPKYYTRQFSDEEKRDNWVSVVAPIGRDGVSSDREGGGPAPVQSDVTLWATLLSSGAVVSHHLPASGIGPERKAYMQMIQTSGFNQGAGGGAHVRVHIGEKEVDMREGDGAFVFGENGGAITVENIGDVVAEILLFDVDQ
ncbi:Pirin-domain-containing protein [Artomyces pyxidatus]|uniref:Pirin-domain-containing protein n=1 Tax=Artomyces pyxidatus TaxID=48021 RepID=A0ACB8T6C3_9AGAM|nr:Pirin-domain-containing protein [Artomyces pyxidatus]